MSVTHTPLRDTAATVKAASPSKPSPASSPHHGTTTAAGRRPRFSAGITIPAAVLALLALAALAPGWLAPADPYAVNPSAAFRAPGAEHLFGTDESGRDVFSRVIHGAGSSLLIGTLATAIGLGIAVVLGTIAGMGNRAVDFGITRFLEVLFAFPGLLLALLVITIFGPGVVTSTIAVGLSTAPGYARIIRTRILSIRRSGYVEAAVVLGKSRWFITTRHILPNVAAPLFVLATLGLGQAIVWASSLSYLGLGAVPPAAEWGAMLAAGRTYIGSAWWLTVFPGLFIVLSAAAATVLGRSIQSRSKEN